MSFNEQDYAAAVAQWGILGEVVTYNKLPSGSATIQVIIDKNVEPYPGGFESASPERRTEITLLKADAPAAKAGETIVTDSETYELVDLISDDGVVISYTARLQ